MSRRAHLFMIRPDLERIAPPLLPEGFTFRTYRPGDETAWLEVIRGGYGGDWPEDAFQRFVLSDASFRAERLFFIAQDGGPFDSAPGRPAFGSDAQARREHGRTGGPCVAVGGAFQNLLHGDRTGYVHMMAVLPEFRRRGLGAALLRKCLLYFREQGWRDAVLDTEATRLPAIRLYLANGFEPFPEVEADVAKWQSVLSELGRP